ncbi:MAG: CehA/McbA family metallohydrolase [Armatimonadota bacterium]|nr:CehA/McbA family metallohydrolase [Armatimonadota bacterium]
MKLKAVFFGLVLLVLFACSCSAAQWMWAKGNLHTHTTNSDGNMPPEFVANLYKDNGYQFLVITDHGKVTDPAPLDTDPNDGFVLIGGEELGVKGAKKPIHCNAIGITTTLPNPEALSTQAESLSNLVESIRKAGGIPQINHPNFGWSFGHREILAVKPPYLLEIANMHPGVNNAGNNAYLPVEQTWDILLSNGRTVYATATDDAHNTNPEKPGGAKPLLGWVCVRVQELTQRAILDALRKGEFYASTGVELENYSFDGKEFFVKVNPKPGKSYVIRFIGKWGRILQETTETSATYRITGKQEPNSYVRCKVICSDETVAWTQAFRIN